MSDFQAFLDADDSIEENDQGNSPTAIKDAQIKGFQRPSRPQSAMSASTTADDGGMMVGGIQVRMPGQSRPNSAGSNYSRLGARPGPQKDRSDGRSQSPAPESASGRGMPGMLGPVDTLRGRGQSPAPDDSPKKHESRGRGASPMAGKAGMLGPVDSLRGRSKSPAPDSSPSKNLGLGPVDMLKGRAPSPAADKMRSGGLLGLGPVDSLRGRSPSPAPELGKSGDSRDKDRARGLLGPVDSLRGRSNSPAPDLPSKPLGLGGLGPVDSLRGRSQSPAPPSRGGSGGRFGASPSPSHHEDSWRDDLSFAGSEDPLAAQGFVALSPSTPSRHGVADSLGSRSFDSPKTMRSGASDPRSPVAAHGRSLAPLSGGLGGSSPTGPEALRGAVQGRSRPSSAVPGRREAHEAPQLVEERSAEFFTPDKHDKKEKKHKKDKKEKKHKKDKKEKKRAKDEASDPFDRSASLESDGGSAPSRDQSRIKEDRDASKATDRSSRKERSGEPAAPPAPVPRPEPVPPPSPPRNEAVAPPSTKSEEGGKEATPRVLRFLLNFDPLRLSVVWEDGGERKTKAMKVDPDDISEARGQQKLAQRLVKKWPCLREQQVSQVEALLRRMVSRRLPIYRVVARDGAATADSPGATEKGTRLPPGTMFLAIERTRCASGWWLRMANGRRWLRQEAATSSSPSLAEAEEWLHSTRKRTMTRLLELNARLVCSQLATQMAPVAPQSSRQGSRRPDK